MSSKTVVIVRKRQRRIENPSRRIAARLSHEDHLKLEALERHFGGGITGGLVGAIHYTCDALKLAGSDGEEAKP